MATMTDALASIDAYVQGIKFDDSAVPYFQLALVFFVLEYVAQTYLDVRQINVRPESGQKLAFAVMSTGSQQSLKLQTIRTAPPPDDLQQHYSQEHLTKTRAYSLDKRTYSLVHGALGAVETLALLWFQLLPDLWAFAARLVGPSWAENEIIVTISFLLFTTVLSTVKELPWSWYYTFVLEEKHGFNKQTRALSVLDTCKSVRALAPTRLSRSRSHRHCTL